MTRKPCALCKEVGQRPADELCWSCRQEIKELRQLKEGLKAESEMKHYNVPEENSYHAYCNWAGRYLIGSRHLHRQQGIGGILAALVIKMCRPAHESQTKIGEPESFLPKRRYDYGLHFKPVYMSDEAAELLVKFKIELDEEISGAYEAGVEYGRNLLAGLASGEISAAEFDAAKTKR